MKRLSKTLADFYVKEGVIDDARKDIYQYGFQLIFADIINFCIVLLIGFFMGRIYESIIYLVTLTTIRRYTGGFHAKTFFVCRIVMIATFFCVVTLTFLLYNFEFRNQLVICFNCFNVIMIAKLSPVENINKPLTSMQKRNNKIKSVIASSIFSFMSIVLVVTLDNIGGVTISVSLSAIVILMIVGFIMRKGGI